MEKIKNLSIQKTIILYMAINLIICSFLGYGIVENAKSIQKQIWLKYSTETLYDGYVYIPRVSNYSMTSKDAFLSEVCDALETWGTVFISFLGTIITIFLFYKHKIKIPLKILVDGYKLISQNELDFEITYNNRDEMGQLCREFDKMRRQLIENNQKMWNLIEQEKSLRSAIAHDIRSPLAVLKGYQEMLLEFIPEEKLEKEKIIEMLLASMQQLKRLDVFIDTMKELSKLEDRELQYQEIELENLGLQIKQITAMMRKQSSIQCDVSVFPESKTIIVDSFIILEVVENLFSNAMRYAKNYIHIEINITEDFLTITIKDDGEGFREEIEKVTQAYYHKNPKDDLHHFGIGLYLCRMYCERHNGRLLLGNQGIGGAYVRAQFQIKI